MLDKIQTIGGIETTREAKNSNKNDKTNKTEIKDGKKKIALALGALGVAGAAAVGIAVAKKKLPKKEIQQAAEKVKAKGNKNVQQSAEKIIKKTSEDGATKALRKQIVLPDGKKVTYIEQSGFYGGKLVDGKFDKATGLLTKTERIANMNSGKLEILGDGNPIKQTIINKKTGDKLIVEFSNGSPCNISLQEGGKNSSLGIVMDQIRSGFITPDVINSELISDEKLRELFIKFCKQ